MVPEDPLTVDEVREITNELQCGKSAGPNGIPPEVFTADGQLLIPKFTESIKCVPALKMIVYPQYLTDARTVHLYKGKDDRSSCDNYHGSPFSALRARSSPRSS